MLAPHPRGFTVSETLRDGTPVTIRAIRPDDRERMRAVYARLSPEAIYLRTFATGKALSEDALRRLVEVDFEREVALVATTGETVIAGGRYVRAAGAPEAEVAFTVDGAWRGKGLASRLLAHLAAIARQRGITRFAADVLAGNRAMLSVFAKSGLAMEKRRDGGTVHLTLAL